MPSKPSSSRPGMTPGWVDQPARPGKATASLKVERDTTIINNHQNQHVFEVYCI